MKKNDDFKWGNEQSHSRVIEALYRKYYSMLHSFLRSIGASDETAEDMIQDIFVQLFLLPPPKLKKKIDKGEMWGYLYTCVRNRFYDFMRSSNRNIKYLEHVGRQKYNANTPYDLYAAKELKNIYESIVKQVLAELEATNYLHYNVFRLREREGLSYKEISKELDISVSKVGVYIHRSNKKIKQKLEDWI